MDFKVILVTGGSGFIGSSFIEYVFNKTNFHGKIINIDALTYAGNPINLAEVSDKYPDRYVFIHGDIRDAEIVKTAFRKYEVDALVHFAAESHVDRSIDGPIDFITTNIMGTFRLLEEARKTWKNRLDVRFHHISTDEVFGSLGSEGYFTEKSAYDPHSPYSASKASSDHLVRSYYHTYGIPITISNCSNNYGPRQFPEKLIPVILEKSLNREALPVYGDGLNVRDWLHVEDHASAVWTVLMQGEPGETYAIGGNQESTNIELVRLICKILAEETGGKPSEYWDLIRFVKDRPGHDKRYAIDASKIEMSLAWKPSRTLEKGMRETVRWYLDNRLWLEQVKSGEYRDWMRKNYEKR